MFQDPGINREQSQGMKQSRKHKELGNMQFRKYREARAREHTAM